MLKLSPIFSAFMLVLTFSLTAQDAYNIGDVVSDFELKNVDGKMVSLTDYDDAKVIVLDFTCLTCPYAKLYEDRTIELANYLAQKEGVLIAINPNDPNRQAGDAFDLMVARADEKGYSFPFVVDETQEIARSYQAKFTPHVMVLENTNKGYILRYRGGIDDNPRDENNVNINYIEKVVDAIVNGDEIPYTETKATGCSIKWKES